MAPPPPTHTHAVQERNTHDRLLHRGSGLGEGATVGGVPFAGESDAERALVLTADPET